MFFGHIKTFRGCLSGVSFSFSLHIDSPLATLWFQLKYNDIAVLESARQRRSHAIVEAITWNCAAEFEASLDHPISFVEDDAFLVIPQKDKFKDFSLKMEVKTMVSISVKLKTHNFIKFTLGQRWSDIL